MGVSLYDSFSLINKQVLTNNFVNASNVGGPDPNINFVGSVNDPAFSLTGAQVNNSDETLASLHLLYDIDHSAPIVPVPNNARITKVTIQMQTSGPPAASSNISVTFPNEGPVGFHGGSVQASGTLKAEVLPEPEINLGIGTVTVINQTQNNNSTSGTGVKTASTSESSAGIIIGYSVDFTTNPGGLYPAGYSTYADFITNFAQMLFVFDGLGSGQAQWLSFSPPDHPTPATGTLTGSITLIVNNFSMEVDWFVPLQWTISPSGLTLPNNVITISRPDPGVPPAQDTQMVQSLQINNQIILPTDPSVIVWLRFTIIIHLMPDMIVSGALNINAQLVGTQFGGYVTLGAVTITKADLSGIYTFDSTVHHDQLYARTTGTTVTTQVVAIPAPFFVTAYFHDDDEEVMHFAGVRMRVTGSGVLKKVFQSFDNINNQQLADLTMQTALNVQPFTIANFIDQDASLRVYTQATDEYMAVSKIIIYMNPIYTGYPQ